MTTIEKAKALIEAGHFVEERFCVAYDHAKEIAERMLELEKENVRLREAIENHLRQYDCICFEGSMGLPIKTPRCHLHKALAEVKG